MLSHDRRAAARRRAWGRGPAILRFEPLEGRQLMAASVLGASPDVLATQFNTVHAAYWGDLFHATGTVANQGTLTTTSPIPVEIYASTAPILGTAGASTVLLGTASIPAGLQPGGSYEFDQIVGLPPATTAFVPPGQPIFITLWVDPHSVQPDPNPADKAGLGLGVDTSILTVTPHQPANLVGTGLNIYPTRTAVANVLSWGDSFNVTQQIQNKGEGDAPPTRARVVLTPQGATPGGYSDVTIGTINVPSIPAFQSANVVQSISLPPIEPATLNGASQFTISVVQDADFLTQPIYPKIADQGYGLDQGPIGILPGPVTATTNNLPDLAPASVVVSQESLNWGQTFAVGTVVQNVGLGDSGKFVVRFVATGVAGDVSKGIFLGDVTVDGLPANAATNVLTTVQLPAKLPYGMTVASPAYARIYAVVDPEDVVNQSSRTNNMASSAPVLLSVVGVDGTTTVPTYPASIYSSATLANQAAKAAQNGTTKATPVLGAAKPAGTKKPVKKPKKDFLASLSNTVTSNVEHQLSVFPDNFNKLLQRIGVTKAPTPAKKTAKAKAAK